MAGGPHEAARRLRDGGAPRILAAPHAVRPAVVPTHMPTTGRLLALCLVLAAACEKRPSAVAAARAGETAGETPAVRPALRSPMDSLAAVYVRTALALGLHDADFVDAYYGPAEWRAEVEREKPSLAAVRDRAVEALRAVEATPAPADSMLRLRREFLRKQLRALVARAEIVGGKRLPFDEESRALFDAVAPRHDEEHFRRTLRQLDALLPGAGPVPARYEQWRRAFVVPPEKLDAVFRRAVEACRARTARRVALPPGEGFRVEYVTGKPWSAYNWYQGSFASRIQVNTSLPFHIDGAVYLGCHEGYPGHHVYNALLERHLVRDRGWVEYSVYPLFSPQSLIAEGSANYAQEMAFPGQERAAFERDSVWPLAGLDPARAAEYYRVQDLVRALNYAENEAARQYLDGTMDAARATQWLATYALLSPEAAAQRLRFIERYRTYVINYNLGQDLVRQYVARVAGPTASEARRWEAFAALLSSPRLPSGL